jgi:hypothetical protein
MSRSFRQMRDHADREHFQDLRASFAHRVSTRRERERAFAALGFDEPEALSALPLYSDADRAQARRALR